MAISYRFVSTACGRRRRGRPRRPHPSGPPRSRPGSRPSWSRNTRFPSRSSTPSAQTKKSAAFGLVEIVRSLERRAHAPTRSALMSRPVLFHGAGKLAGPGAGRMSGGARGIAATHASDESIAHSPSCVAWILLGMFLLGAGPPSCWFPKQDAYRGWTGMQLAATGRFRVEQVNGVWWLVTPTGHPFFSAGVNHASSYGDWAPQLGTYPYRDADPADLRKRGGLVRRGDRAPRRAPASTRSARGARPSSSPAASRTRRSWPSPRGRRRCRAPTSTRACEELRDYFDPAFASGAAQEAENERATARTTRTASASSATTSCPGVPASTRRYRSRRVHEAAAGRARESRAPAIPQRPLRRRRRRLRRRLEPVAAELRRDPDAQRADARLPPRPCRRTRRIVSSFRGRRGRALLPGRPRRAARRRSASC